MNGRGPAVLLRAMGAVMLVLGGASWLAALVVGDALDPLTTTSLGATVDLVQQWSPAVVGLGLALAGASIRGRGIPLVAAGAAGLLSPVLEAVQDALTGPPSDPRPGPVALLLLEIVLLVVAAIVLLVQRGSPRSLRFSMTPPAAAFVLLVVADLVPFLTGGPVVSMILLDLPPAAMVPGGVLLLVSIRRHPSQRLIAPVLVAADGASG